jgi:hypothetical protein
MVGVFLSHSSKDKPFVRDLAAPLEAGGAALAVGRRPFHPDGQAGTICLQQSRRSSVAS